MRGMFTAGVIDTMMRHGIEYDAVIGVSAGACFGCNYKSRQIGRPLRYNLRFSRDWRYCSVRSLLLTGDLYGAKFCYHTLPNQLDVMDKKTYDSNPTKFIVVCTDMKTGKPVYRQIDTVSDESFEWYRASASMPLVSRIVRIDGYELLDGGISDSIPVRYMEKQGYDRLVIVKTRPEEYRKTPQPYMKLIRLALHRYPRAVKALEQRHRMYNDTTAHIRHLEKTGKAFVIQPSQPLAIHQTEHDPAVIQKVYDTGCQVALSRLEALQQYLQP